MGDEFGDENERLITRLENTQYDTQKFDGFLHVALFENYKQKKQYLHTVTMPHFDEE